ncbi:hypothetical protein LUZ62_037111 [Rhynchospora pubera]|uniref:Enoyl reductase (ER) domain-containing protein n=1 Tax=Rhynchospora pubera TaxID=906938 RepID=A0AAV8F2K9_9POAL|nr:hypothetical protein LUZ62_037111 [Rhynchospora pubera]
MAETMKAVQYDKYGGGAAGLKHVEVPVPSPKKDEMLIKVEAASINPVDWKIQKGMLRPFMPRKFPFIPVIDVAGEVLELGPGVSNFKVGEKILGLLDFTVKPSTLAIILYLHISLLVFSNKLNAHFQNGGGLAEYAVAPKAIIAKRPTNMSPAEAAGLPAAGLTAFQSLKSAGVKFDGTNKSSNILITAASGGVGHFAVQLAKVAGLHVTATCGARNVELVKKLGSDEVLDYKTPEGAALKSPSGVKYDYVVHCAPPVLWSVFEPVLSDHGKVVDITPTMRSIFSSLIKKVTFAKKKLAPLFLVPKEGELEFLVNLAEEGKLKTVIDSKHPLSKAEDAWAKSIEGHATGKIIVEM